VRADHPLRPIRESGERGAEDLSDDLCGLYTNFGRPSIAPEKLLRQMLCKLLRGTSEAS